MKSKTQEKYLQIFALYKQGIPPTIIAERMKCSIKTIYRATKWCVDNAPRFTTPEHLKIQIEKVRELKLEARQRLQKIREGVTEKIVKKHYGEVVESVERTKYNQSVEVALIRVIKDLISEESTLLGVYDACVPPDDATIT